MYFLCCILATLIFWSKGERKGRVAKEVGGEKVWMRRQKAKATFETGTVHTHCYGAKLVSLPVDAI